MTTPRTATALPGAPSADDRDLAAAIALAERLRSTAEADPAGGIRWRSADHAAPRPVDLYDGALGAALFFGALDRVVTGTTARDRRDADAARAALAGPRHRLRQLRARPTLAHQLGFRLGAACGCGAFLYVLALLGRWLDEPTWLDEAVALTDLLTPEAIAADRALDVVNGSAGTILGLLALVVARGPNDGERTRLLDHATRCGEHLLAARVPTAHGVAGWAAPGRGPLGGFAHGATGIGQALVSLATATGRRDFLEAGRAAFAFERGHFDASVGNWRDLRHDRPRFMTSWCHGAAGIALARLATRSALADPAVHVDLNHALDATLGDRSTAVHTVCCGAMGRIDAALHATRITGDDRPRVWARALTDTVLADARAHGDHRWALAPRYDTFGPGFFTGAAGIGYVLLRMRAPTLPCVLAFEAPTEDEPCSTPIDDHDGLCGPRAERRPAPRAGASIQPPHQETTMIPFIEDLGRRLADAWRRHGYDEEAFADLATAAVTAARPQDHLSAETIIDWLFDAHHGCRQPAPDPFGDPPVLLYETPTFQIVALFWLTTTTTIHAHAFSGCFAVLDGASLHSHWHFDDRRRINSRMHVGRLRLGESEILGVGDVRPIRSGRRMIHQLFHLDMPSVSLVVRTHQDRDQLPQLVYHPPGVALDSTHVDGLRQRRIALLNGMMTSAGLSDVERHAATLLERGDLETVYHALRALTRPGRLAPARVASLIDGARQCHGAIVDRLVAAAREQHRIEGVAARRALVRDPDHRYLLALLMLMPDRDSVLDGIRLRVPDAPPRRTLDAWLDAMSGLDTLGLELDDVNRVIVAGLLDGDDTASIVERLAAIYGHEALDAERGALEEHIRDLAATPTLQPLFSASPARH